MKIKYKQRFNDISHDVRSEQLIGQYGVGAMVDFQEQTLMVSAHEYWNANIKQVHDERLQRALHVSYFGMPVESRDAQDGISYVRFPKWYFCPRCRRFMPIESWVEEHKKYSKKADRDPIMAYNLKCYKCQQPLVVTRVVTICENGHIDDFPWVAWAHKKNRSGERPICPNPQLLFKTGNSSSEGLEGLQVECTTCHSSANMADAFSPDIFENLFREKGFTEFKCTGIHPWDGTKCNCGAFPKAKQRGASAIYFPSRVSSLIIPLNTSENKERVEDSTTFKTAVEPTMDGCEDEEEKLETFTLKKARWCNRISTETGLDVDTIEKIIRSIYISNDDSSEYDINSVQYKLDEYTALSAPVTMSNQLPDFYREEMNIDEYGIPGVDKIVLIKKLREVQALIGFSRLKPVETVTEDNKDRFVSIKSEKVNWYPGTETHGEGIFIRFDNEAIDKWASQDEVIKRITILRENDEKSSNSFGNVAELDAKFVLLHTLAHVLIKQLSFECGYSVSSLKERIYSSSAEDTTMAGILIYTASGDSEGTLGGLVRQGKSDSLTRILKAAIEEARICSNDPVCIMSNGQGRDALNLAACYACALLPETSCESFNMYLDRAMLVGTLDNPDFGFFSDFSSAKYVRKIHPKVKKILCEDSNEFNPVNVVYKNDGMDMKSKRYSEIWDYVMDETDDESDLDFFEKLKALKEDPHEKPLFGETIVFGINRTTVHTDLLWKNSKVMYFFGENSKEYKKALDSGWHCVCLSDHKIEIEEFLGYMED